MKKLGCGLGILGLLLFAASFAVFGREMFKAKQAHAVTTIPLTLGRSISSDLIKVDAAKLCSISVRGSVQSSHAQHTISEENHQESYQLQYALPFRYSVRDATGKLFVTEEQPFAWNSGTRSTSNSEVSERGGSEDIEHSYKKFKVLAPGEIRIDAEIDPDNVFGAEAKNLSLVVYDNVTEHTKSVAAAFAMLFAGAGIGFIGLVIFIIAAVTGSKK